MQEGYKTKKNAGSFESLEKCSMLGGLEKCRKVDWLKRRYCRKGRKVRIMQDGGRLYQNVGRLESSEEYKRSLPLGSFKIRIDLGEICWSIGNSQIPYMTFFCQLNYMICKFLKLLHSV